MTGMSKRKNTVDRGWESQKLATLLEISQSLHQYLNIDDLISHISERISDLMPVAAISVILHDEAKNEFVFCWSSDLAKSAEKFDPICFPADQGIAGSVLRSGRAELILDVDNDPRHFKRIDDIGDFKTKSMIAVPLKTKKKTIGVLEILNKLEGVFDKKDLDFLTTLSPIIAMALDNARMYGQLDQAYKELQVIDKGKDELIKQTMSEVDILRREVEKRYSFEQIIGKSDLLVEVFRLCEKVIDSDITVLIEGESGTGKELIAQSIHHNGPRRSRPFVSQNCGGIPDTLLASELFGHKRGAFTGAFSDRKGLFEVADGGTVFLDEVEEMSPAMQASLLRVLQEGDIKPLGGEHSKKVDIRVISATNRKLEDYVREAKFREDLFYRLNVFPIRLPPLRERAEDIPLLANHFLKKYTENSARSVKSISQEASRCLASYPFPGNVRELENEIERAIAMAEGAKTIEALHLSEKIRSHTELACHGTQFQGTLKEMVETLEKSVLSRSLQKNGGNKSRMAKELGLSRYGLMKKMQRYGL
jgi:transcriptional regulator with GAF, ATPase, and Fis domain